MSRTKIATPLGWAVLLALLSALAQPASTSAQERDAAAEAVKWLGRGMNLGNALEAPREGAWGMKLEAEYFALIRKAGFDSVRIPIRWSAHAAKKPPFTIDSAFLERVDWAIGQALKNELAVVINVHHFDEMDRDPDAHKEHLQALWRQIADHYRNQPKKVIFELLNEPHDKLTDERWNDLIPGLLQTVRQSNPDRMVIVGPGHWNGIQSLIKLQLPEADRRLIVTVHYYSPFEFTHQGASWVKGSGKWKGRKWTGSPAERAALTRDFQSVADWASKHRRAIYLGEFGAFEAADMPSRARWTAAVVHEAQEHGWAWAYWEFGSGFGAYDRAARMWRDPLLRALVPAP
jgi:endoglucanase